MVLPSAGPCTDLQTRYGHWCNRGMKVMGLTDHFLVKKEACSTEGNRKPGQRPITRKPMIPRAAPTVVLLMAMPSTVF